MADPANPRDRQGSQDIEMQPLPPNPAADSAHDTLGTVPPDDNDQGQNPPADGDGLGPNAPRNQGPNPRRGRRGGNRGDAVDRIDQFNDGVRRLNRKTVMYCIIIWVLVAAIIVLFIALHEMGVLGGKHSSEPAAKNSTLDANSTSEANLTSPKLMERWINPEDFFPPSRFFFSNPDYAPPLYPVSYFEYYPPRQNVHDRHRRNFSDKSIFLPPTIPSDIISRIPAPENWSTEDGAQESCQSPIRWTYPIEGIASEETNTVTGEIPVPPADECVRRIKFPWQGRGENHYTIRWRDAPGKGLMFKHHHYVSQGFQGTPVGIEGEIIVLNTEKGVEDPEIIFEIFMSSEKLAEVLYPWKYHNNTVILHTHTTAYKDSEECVTIKVKLMLPRDIEIPSLTIHSVAFPVIIENGVSFVTGRLEIISNGDLIMSRSKNYTVQDSIVLALNQGNIQGWYPLANSLNAACETRNLILSTNILTSKNMSSMPEITTTVGTGDTLLEIRDIPPTRHIVRSSHITGKGGQHIVYPPNWTGLMSCQLAAGNCTLSKNVRVLGERHVEEGINVYRKAGKGDVRRYSADTFSEVKNGFVNITVLENGPESEEQSSFGGILYSLRSKAISLVFRRAWVLLLTIFGLIVALALRRRL